MKRILSTFLIALGLSTSAFTASAHAAGSATFSLSPSAGSYVKNSTFSVQVFENGTDVTVVTAKLTYDPAKLQCIGVTSTFGGNPIPQGTSCGNGNISISGFSMSTVSGTQTVGTINFTTLSDSGSTSVNFGSGSQIASNGSNIWNGTISSATFTFSAPSPTTGGQGGEGNGTSNTSSNGAQAKPASSTPQTKKVASASNTQASTSANGTTEQATEAAQPTNTEGSVQGSSDQSAMSNPAQTTQKSNGSNAVALGLLAAVVAAGVGVTIRNGSLVKAYRSVIAKFTQGTGKDA